MFPATSQAASAYCTLPTFRKTSKVNPAANITRGDCSRLPSGESAATSSSPTYGTMGRKLRRVIKSQDESLPPYKKLRSESEENSSFGLSNDLSTESIRNACEYVELSDDEVGSGLPTFQERICDERKSLRTPYSSVRDQDKWKKDEHPFCTMRRSISGLPATTPLHLNEERYKRNINHSSLTLNQEEAINVLNELDAILDNHAGSSAELRSSSEQTEKVEDYLLELDTYLDELDDKSVSSSIDCDNSEVLAKPHKRRRRPQSLPKNMRAVFALKKANKDTACDSISLNRGHVLRKTIGSGSLMRSCRSAKQKNITSNINTQTTGKFSRASSPTRKSWRRNSMRKTSLLVLPDHGRVDCEEEDDEEEITPTTSAAEELIEQPQVEEAPTTEESNEPTESPTNTANVRRCISQVEFTPNFLTPSDILQEMVQRSSAEGLGRPEDRPRQFGRRCDGHLRVFSIRSEETPGGNHCVIINHDRPLSAPISTRRNENMRMADVMCSEFIGSEPSSVASTRNPSPVSLISSTGSSSMGSTTADQPPHSTSTPQLESNANNQPRIPSLDTENSQTAAQQGFNAEWPQAHSRTLALLCCTLGLFNICRFANQTIHYGGNFLLQFLLLSVIFGIPLFWLQMCLGAKIKAGPVSMWKISPICRGIGIALVIGQCIMALYSTVSIGWLLVYLRDSFLTKTQPLYRWQESFYMYRRATNTSGSLTETVADYFNGIVLQRLHLSRHTETGDVRFQVSDRLAFNLAIVWALVFLILCKGLKSFGKVVIALTLVPLVLFVVITCRLLHHVGFSNAQNIFSGSDFEDFLINSKTWVAAAQETFLTWGLLGASVIAICSRSHKNSSSKVILRREALLVVLLTLLGLGFAALFGFSCEQILSKNDFIYVPGSYEYIDTYTSVFSLKTPISPALVSIPTKWIPHYSTLLGETYRRPPLTAHRESGYQVLRLITELFPTAVALSHASISWVWTALTILMFILFGLGQLCAIWKPISSALGNSTSSVLLSCVTALLLGIPFATEMGLSIVHYLDLVFGGAWWLLILWTAEILAVFLIRGRPYNGDVLVNDLRMNGSMSAFLALSWNVLLPIGMVSLAIIQYKVSLSSQFYHWRGKSYFSFWARKVGGLTQVGFLLVVPITAIIQIYRYLTNGPSDILDRIQLLYRPTQSPLPHRRNRPGGDRNNTSHTHSQYATRNTDLEASNTQDDAPPKYTPPPSYTTATGARLAKVLRQSIRRSVRRLLGEPSRTRPIISLDSSDNRLPPDYSTVLSNPDGVHTQREEIEIRPRPLYNSYTHRTLSLGRIVRTHKVDESSDMRPSSAGITLFSRPRQPYTASDVASVLRSSSHRRGTGGVNSIASRIDQSLRNKTSWSAENLVINAAPLGESNAITVSATPNSLPDNPPDRLDIYENTSVI